MDHDYLLRLKETHPTLRLLAADNAPLIISFLHAQFVEPNQRSIGYSDLVSRLEDHLYQLRAIHGDERYPKGAKAYLNDWSDARSPYLRKYYPAVGDEPAFDLSPAAERAIEWLQGLQARPFVGTESRLLTVFRLLREVVHNTEQDPEERIRELERQKAGLDAQIARIRSGAMDSFEPAQIQERFFQAEDTARRLLSDFRQVEHNFRLLDRATRERIATGDRSKGEMLDQIFGEQDVIRDSAEGKSFRGFWEFLMSPERQMELDELLERVFELEAVREIDPERFLRRIRFYLLEAGEKVHQTNNLLVEQLRKYLDDQAWLENRRIMDLIRGIERRAVAVREHPPEPRDFMVVDELRPNLDLVMARSLFRPPRNPVIAEQALEAGEVEVEVDALFRQTVVDETELEDQVRRLLQTRPQVSLAEVIEQYPVRHGVAEVVGYLNLATREGGALRATVDEGSGERVSFELADARRRVVRLPRVIFLR